MWQAPPTWFAQAASSASCRRRRLYLLPRATHPNASKHTRHATAVRVPQAWGSVRRPLTPTHMRKLPRDHPARVRRLCDPTGRRSPSAGSQSPNTSLWCLWCCPPVHPTSREIRSRYFFKWVEPVTGWWQKTGPRALLAAYSTSRTQIMHSLCCGPIQLPLPTSHQAGTLETEAARQAVILLTQRTQSPKTDLTGKGLAFASLGEPAMTKQAV